MAAIGFLGRATSGPLTIREAGSSREEVPRRLVEQGFRAPMSTVGKRRPVRIDPGKSRSIQVNQGCSSLIKVEFFGAGWVRIVLMSRTDAGDENVPRVFQRCGHPGQQQGRRMPLCILSIPTSIRRLRVASCFAEVTQQIHSLRARGVKAGQTLLATASNSMAFRKSAGSLCTVPSANFCVGILRRVSDFAINFMAALSVSPTPVPASSARTMRRSR